MDNINFYYKENELDPFGWVGNYTYGIYGHKGITVWLFPNAGRIYSDIECDDNLDYKYNLPDKDEMIKDIKESIYNFYDINGDEFNIKFNNISNLINDLKNNDKYIKPININNFKIILDGLKQDDNNIYNYHDPYNEYNENLLSVFLDNCDDLMKYISENKIIMNDCSESPRRQIIIFHEYTNIINELMDVSKEINNRKL